MRQRQPFVDRPGVISTIRRGRSCALLSHGCAADALEARTLLAADLAASMTYMAGTYYSGQTIAAAMLNEINVGSESADGFGTRVVLSTNRTYGDDDDLELLRVDREDNPLAPGELASAAQTLTILPTISAGRYYVIVKTDVDNDIAENVEGNNLWVSASADLLVAKPVITIAATDKTASETGPNNGRFRITRTGPTDTALTVSYTVSGTATATGGLADFDALSGTATIAAGQSGVNIVIRPINDSRVEGVERVVLTVGAGDGYTLGAATSGRVDINDNDGARVRIVATDSAATENEQGTATLVVSRAGGLDGDLVVRYSLSGTARNGIDYTELPGEITILDGQTSATITLTPTDDAVGELTETVMVTLSASSSYLLVSSRRTARASIADNEPVVKIAATDAASTENGAGTGTYTVTRVGTSTAPLTVVYTIGGSAGSGDYVALSGMVTIPSGQLNATITLTPIDDAIAEGVENVAITLAAADGYRIDSARRRAIANIADNEPVVSISASDATATENNASTATFTVSRTGSPTGTVTVDYTVSGTAASGTDFLALSGTVVIPDGQASTTIVLTPIDDSMGEGSETVVVTLAARTAYTRNGAKTIARATIADNEPSVSIIATDAAAAETVDGDGNLGVFTVSRTGSTVGSVTIPYTISGSGAAGTDYQTLEGSLTIADGESSATITVTPIDDFSAESAESVSVTLTGNAGYLLSTSRKSATVTIADNEPIVSIVATDASANEGDAATAVFTVSRATATTDELIVGLTITGTGTNGADYQTITTTVTIAADATSATVTLTPLQDLLGEGDETVIVTIADNAGYTILTIGGKNRATATIRDDEPVVSIAVTDNTATEQDETDGVFTLTRTGSSDQLQMELTVQYRVEGTAEAGDDFEALDGEVTFAAGSNRATITVTAIDDGEGESNESVTITLEAEDGAAYGVDTARAAATVSITDNEPVVTIAATDAAAAENNNPGVFTIRRTGSTLEELVVTYTISGTATPDTDYPTLSGTVSIPADAASVTINVAPHYDLATENSETVKLTLGAGAGYKLSTAKEATVTIANAQAVDLSLLSVSYFGRSYSLASTGVSSPIVLNLSNLGDAISAAFVSEFRLSTNTTWGDDDDIVIGTSSSAALGGGASITINFNFAFDAVKSRLSAGSYYLGVRIDPLFRVLEASESNNTFFSSSADIVVVD